MKRTEELERALVVLLKAIDSYQIHGEMMGSKHKDALLDAKVNAIKVLQGETK
jgi:hypothetical protein